MSRFASPTKLSLRSNEVANYPSIPVQKEKGHRYGKGVSMKGASMKGNHFGDIIVEGTRKNLKLIETDSEKVLPSPTLKVIEIKFKEDRTVRRKSPTPSLSLENRSTSPFSTSSFRFPKSKNSAEEYDINQWELSTLASSRGKSNYSRSISASAANSYRKSVITNEFNQSFTSRSKSPLPLSSSFDNFSSFSTSKNGSPSMRSFNRSLASSSPPSHAIHNIQLTHAANRAARKQKVRESIAQFIKNYGNDSSLSPQDISLSYDSNDYIDLQQNIVSKMEKRRDQMIEHLKSTIHHEITSLQSFESPDLIFFPSENFQSSTIVHTTRIMLSRLMNSWLKKSYDCQTHLEQMENELKESKLRKTKLTFNANLIEQSMITSSKTLEVLQNELFSLQQRADELGLDWKRIFEDISLLPNPPPVATMTSPPPPPMPSSHDKIPMNVAMTHPSSSKPYPYIYNEIMDPEDTTSRSNDSHQNVFYASHNDPVIPEDTEFNDSIHNYYQSAKSFIEKIKQQSSVPPSQQQEPYHPLPSTSSSTSQLDNAHSSHPLQISTAPHHNPNHQNETVGNEFNLQPQFSPRISNTSSLSPLSSPSIYSSRINGTFQYPHSVTSSYVGGTSHFVGEAYKRLSSHGPPSSPLASSAMLMKARSTSASRQRSKDNEYNSQSNHNSESTDK